MVSLSASVDLPLHHKVQKFSSGTGSPGWSGKKAVNRLCVCVCLVTLSEVKSILYVLKTTSGQSNLMAAADGQFNCIWQVAPMCTPSVASHLAFAPRWCSPLLSHYEYINCWECPGWPLFALKIANLDVGIWTPI